MLIEEGEGEDGGMKARISAVGVSRLKALLDSCCCSWYCCCCCCCCCL